MVQVRLANEDDVNNLLQMERNIFSANGEVWNDESISFAIKDDSYRVYIIEEDKVYGYAILQYSEFESYIAKFAIDKKYRSNGYGYELLKFIIDNINSEQIILEVRKSNDIAINLYIKAGFEYKGIRKRMYEHPVEDAVIMIRKA